MVGDIGDVDGDTPEARVCVVVDGEGVVDIFTAWGVDIKGVAFRAVTLEERQSQGCWRC